MLLFSALAPFQATGACVALRACRLFSSHTHMKGTFLHVRYLQREAEKKGERRTISFRSRCAVRVLIIDVPLHLKTKSFLLLRFAFILLLQIGNIENKQGII